MKKKDNYIHQFKSAVADFKRNKVRTFLTSLGITIGVLSVVLLIAFGLGLKNYIQQQFEGLGGNLLFVRPGQSINEGGFGRSFGGLVGGINFDEKDLKNIQKIPTAKYTAPMSLKSTIVETEDEKVYSSVMGSNEDIFPILNLDPLAGELLTKTDIEKGSKEIVLGKKIAETLFGDPENGVGRTVRISNQRFKVKGVIQDMGDPEVDNGVIMSYKTAFGSLNPTKDFLFIYVSVDDESNIESTKDEIINTLSKRYDEDEFTVFEQAELLDTINSIFSILNVVLVAIGSISLVVGGVGIMNIMYATVTERTKEIGIRRSVGATEKDILNQFLSESIILSVLGGTLGLLIATVIVLIVRPFFPLAINLFAVIITFTISSAIGVFFGVFPARRASKLPPIEAIRYQ